MLHSILRRFINRLRDWIDVQFAVDFDEAKLSSDKMLVICGENDRLMCSKFISANSVDFILVLTREAAAALPR